MRNIINISLPINLTREVEREVKENKFASKSEFFRYLFREWKAHKFATALTNERVEFKKGKTKILKSMKDLR